MCGRFACNTDRDELTDRFDATVAFPRMEPRFNVAPGQMMPIIVRQSPKKAIPAKWGLIPSWSKDPKIAYRTINARAEGIAEKPVFRGSFKNKR